MNYLKSFLVMAGVLLITSCGEQPKNQHYQAKLDLLVKENDSLKKELLNNSKTTDTIPASGMGEDRPDQSESNKGTNKGGQHPISLQWIGWDRPGTAIIKPLDNEWYSISGSQKNKAGDYLSIEGKIKRISEKELAFEGTIITKVSHNNGGEPCIKEGKQTFYGKGKRTYFRLQNMTNCEGGMLVDYVDIYPGGSKL